MRKSKKQLLRTMIACGLVVSVAAGGTVAYLTDAETATNTFTVGKVKIDLEEPGYPGNDSDEVKNIIPNQEIVKDPQIENTGNNNALVFLRVEVPQETFTDEDDGTGEQKKQDLFRLKGISDQWELLRTETVTGEDGKAKTSYVYGYKKTLGKDATTDKLFQRVQMKNAVESDLSGNVEDIIVTACAIQATDIPDVNLTPGSDGNLSKDALDQVYTIFLNQSGNQTSRPADEGDRNQSGKLGKISYELDGGTLAAGTLTEYGSADYGYTPPAPAKKNYTFTGWEPENIPAGSTGTVNCGSRSILQDRHVCDVIRVNSRYPPDKNIIQPPGINTVTGDLRNILLQRYPVNHPQRLGITTQRVRSPNSHLSRLSGTSGNRHHTHSGNLSL